jgi:hypothetical protein
MLQNGKHYKTVRITKWNVLQNGTRYKAVQGTKQYALQNGTRFKTVTLQNSNVTKRYVLQNGMLQNVMCCKTVHNKG